MGILLGDRIKALDYNMRIKITVNNKFNILNLFKSSLSACDYKYIKDYYNLPIDREELEENEKGLTIHLWVISDSLEKYVLEKENEWYESKDSRLLWWRYRNDNKI